jgi:hypothetical protein
MPGAASRGSLRPRPQVASAWQSDAASAIATDSGARHSRGGEGPWKTRVRPVGLSDLGGDNRTSSRHRTGSRRDGQHPTGLLMDNPNGAQLYRAFADRGCWEMS